MERDLLAGYLEQGLSLEQIGGVVNRHHSTIAYWLKRHGLLANGHERHSARGGLAREQLEPLIERGLTLREMAALLCVSVATVRYWMNRFGLRTRRHRGNRDIGVHTRPVTIFNECVRHGQTEFVLENRGAYRCKQCRSESVSNWRKRLKRVLITEAGGACALCGYSRHPAALHFHHVDPAAKKFSLRQEGITRSLQRARAEARKCVLLCANCHAEVEAGAASLS
jgi:transposase